MRASSFPSHKRGGHIIAVARALLDGVGRGQPFALFVEDHAGEQARRPGANAGHATHTIGGERRLNSAPKLSIDDRRMLARIDFAIVADLAAVEAVLQQRVQRPARKTLAAIFRTIGPDAPLAADTDIR